jgi:hypothetical protein
MSKKTVIFFALSLLVVIAGTANFIWVTQDVKSCPSGYSEQENICVKDTGF